MCPVEMRDLAADKGCEMTASPAEKGDIGLERGKKPGKKERYSETVGKGRGVVKMDQTEK